MERKIEVTIKAVVDLDRDPNGDTSLNANLGWAIEDVKYTVLEINGIKFTEDKPFSECMWCDGCDDDDIDGDERNAHIVPELLAINLKEA